MQNIRFGCWNAGGIKNKTENITVNDFINAHDVIALSEIKTALPINFHGFRTIYGNGKHKTRGGVAVLVRNRLYDDICCIDSSVDDQIWFSLSCIPNVVIGACYIPPRNSPYFGDSYFANLHGKILADPHKKYIILGDLNSRCGYKVNELVIQYDTLQYFPIDIESNTHGEKLLQICKDTNMFILNNLSVSGKLFKSALTFRRKKVWLSEVDLCVVSKFLIHACNNLFVDQNLKVPSDHANVSISIDCSKLPISINNLLIRAEDLGGHAVCLRKPSVLTRKPIPFKDIDPDIFANKIASCDIPPLYDNCDINTVVDDLTNTLYECSVASRRQIIQENSCVSYNVSRWQRIMASKDEKLLWAAINWNGNFDRDPLDGAPSDDEFQVHLEQLLNPSNINPAELHEIQSDIHIPVLDEPIRLSEVEHAIKNQVKPRKSCGPDGVSPGVFKLLPATWIVFLSLLLNIVFNTCYPASWSLAKLNMLFKKGCMSNCNNYRSISIINNIAKIYDYILHNRLTKWFTPDREQAGAQQKRGCIEHIITLRLIIDFSFRKKEKLFVAFIDFSKAYDRVPRHYLFNLLKSLGCGCIMLAALISLYSITKNILGSVIICAIVGVRQGSPTSCFLFIMFVNVLVRNLKKCEPDGFLSWLHCLMLMDDTVIFATTRQRLELKLNILNDFCLESGMQINNDKTKFFVVNGDEGDKLPFLIGTVVMPHCLKYTYLGAEFTCDGSMHNSLQAHVNEKEKHLNKLILFYQKNPDMPFHAKKKVLDAAFCAALLYGCESWLNVSVYPVEKMYHTAIKCLLSVRPGTSNNACLAELGYPSLMSVIKKRQQSYLTKKIEERKMLKDDPLIYALKLTKLSNPPMWKYIDQLLKDDDILHNGQENLKQLIKSSEKSKLITYAEMNPEVIVHPVYVRRDAVIPEHTRISFTRFRTSSHRLRIETGRWSRLSREQRLCSCGKVQDEKHVLTECEKTQVIRDKYGQTSIKYPQFLSEMESVVDFQTLYEILKISEPE